MQKCCNCGKEMEGEFHDLPEKTKLGLVLEKKWRKNGIAYVEGKSIDFCEHCGCCQLVREE